MRVLLVSAVLCEVWSADSQWWPALRSGSCRQKDQGSEKAGDCLCIRGLHSCSSSWPVSRLRENTRLWNCHVSSGTWNITHWLILHILCHSHKFF